MRETNSNLILNLIWRERVISRADIARRTGFSRSTVSTIVEHLLRTGLVDESGTGDSSGGRRPILLKFMDDACGLVGIELDATFIRVALTNLRGQILASRTLDFPVAKAPRESLSQMAELIRECLKSRRMGLRKVLGIGVAVPCPIDPADPSPRLLPEVFPGWRETDLIAGLQEDFPVPVFMDNDANLGALAELFWGAGRDGRSLVFIKAEKGIGAGLIIDGKIYRGSRGLAGEVGHMVVESDGQRSHCGMTGCLTAHAGAYALLEQWTGRPGGLSHKLDAEGLSLSALNAAAAGGDAQALALLGQAARYVGICIANILNILNPDTVVLGGGLFQVQDGLLDLIGEAIRTHTLWPSIASARVVLSDLGPYNIAVGAATQVLCGLLTPHDTNGPG